MGFCVLTVIALSTRSESVPKAQIRVLIEYSAH
jgi:hypothetical protein